MNAQFLASMQKMIGNWSVEEGRLDGVFKNYEAKWREVGSERFDAAINKVVQRSDYRYMPTIAEFSKCIPDPKWRERRTSEELEFDYQRRLDRANNPDEFFGEADVVCMMRISESRATQKQAPLTGDQTIAAVLESRKLHQ